MNDALDAVLGDHAFDEVFIAGVADEQRHAFGQEDGESGGQIVDHDDAFAGFHQRVNHMTSDIAGATGDEHGHGSPLALEFGKRARTQSRFPLMLVALDWTRC